MLLLPLPPLPSGGPGFLKDTCRPLESAQDSHFTSSLGCLPTLDGVCSSGHRDSVALRYTSESVERHRVQWHGLSACPVVTVCDILSS